MGLAPNHQKPIDCLHRHFQILIQVARGLSISLTHERPDFMEISNLFWAGIQGVLNLPIRMIFGDLYFSENSFSWWIGFYRNRLTLVSKRDQYQNKYSDNPDSFPVSRRELITHFDGGASDTVSVSRINYSQTILGIYKTLCTLLEESSSVAAWAFPISHICTIHNKSAERLPLKRFSLAMFCQ